MKWRISWDGKLDFHNFVIVCFLANFAWFLTTLLIHDLLKRALGLPADAGYRDSGEDVVAAVMLPLVIPVTPVVVATLFGIEVWWRSRRILCARVGYCVLSLMLLLWCWWSLQTSLSYGYQNQFHGYRITDTVQAAAYAANPFPIALACACLLSALLRRAPPPV